MTQESTGPEVREKLQELRRVRHLKYVLWVTLVAAVLGVTYWGLGFIGFQAEVVARRFPKMYDFIREGFFPPDFQNFTVYTKDNEITGLRAIPASFRDFGQPIIDSLGSSRQSLVKASLVTLLLGFMGTVMAFPFALVLGVLGSERVMPFPFNFIFRGTLSAIRAIPAIVWIFLYIPIGPPGQVTAVLAIATDSIGNLGRLFTDDLEEIEEGPIEAIRSTGASGTQTVSFGMLSQVSRSFIAWTLYILEINTRIAISLGVVGAGGLGYMIRNSQDLFQFRQTAAGLIMVFIVVLGIELVSSRIRARLRPGEHSGKSFTEAVRDLFDPNKWLGLTTKKRD
ncbi:phosphonate transport system permease protein [Halobiforma haloterrestris]|uniref:Phosphonate transport system permease protein n=1 Tax=Natronobacterium haloterrestre TaxID=148448 RepID=A0A1I1GTY1_NATHA|nr:phosphonate ABC transporter, permease protein PhnE [Halobiforma haloterrestris]SFC15289.1 phosphonate transport system permease protein [Halobiforma haloterrestris]